MMKALLMSTYNICFHEEKLQYFLVEKIVLPGALNQVSSRSIICADAL